MSSLNMELQQKILARYSEGKVKEGLENNKKGVGAKVSQKNRSYEGFTENDP